MQQLNSNLTFYWHGKSVPVASVEDAARKWCEFRDRAMAGCSEIGNGGTVKQGRNVIARISYNGRVWLS